MSDDFRDTSIDIKPELTFEPFKEESKDIKIIEEKKEVEIKKIY